MIALRNIERGGEGWKLARPFRSGVLWCGGAVRHIPLRFAGHGAGLAAHTAFLINDHRITRHRLGPLFRGRQKAHEVHAHSGRTHDGIDRYAGDQIGVGSAFLVSLA